MAKLCDQVTARGIIVDGLVNNAGYGVPGAYVNSTWETQHAFLQVMVVAVAELTHRLLPGMLERGYGRILNVASLAGLVPAPAGHTLYAASKSFMIKFSESLAHEVGHRGVHVTALCPGFTLSEFHDVTRHARDDEQDAVVHVDGFADGGAPGLRRGHARNAGDGHGKG